MKIGVGIAVLLTGMALLLPAAAQAWQKGLVEFVAFGWMEFGLVLLVTGAVVTFSPYKKRVA